jgi:hypothetical protein
LKNYWRKFEPVDKELWVGDLGSEIRDPEIPYPGSGSAKLAVYEQFFSPSARQRVSQDAGQEENYWEENVSKATFSESSHLGRERNH